MCEDDSKRKPAPVFTKKKKDGVKNKIKDGNVRRRKKTSQEVHSSLLSVSSKQQELMADLFPTLQPNTSDDSV